jgi:hypothetical protein
MVKTPEALKGKPFPKFIKKHLIFRVYPEVDKVFPKLGLTNIKEKVGATSEEDLKKIGEAAIKNLLGLVNTRKYHIRNTSQIYGYHRGRVVNRPKSWKEKKKATLAILSSLTRELGNNPKSFIKVTNNKISLRMPKKISSGDFSMAKGRDVFTELSKLNKAVHQQDFPTIVVNRNKVLGSIATPSKKSNIVFASEGTEGLWDIATMSMRGISSCQRWGSSHANCLIGSMIDPYTGIIYLTGGKHKYGSKMEKRAVVRLVLSRKGRKPALMIERIYPYNYDSETKDQVTLEIFKRFLEKKTNNKYPIVYGDSAERKKYFIPLSEQVEDLNVNEKSYRDSHIGYQAVNRDITKYLS